MRILYTVLGFFLLLQGCSSTSPILKEFEPFEHTEKRLVGVITLENKTGKPNYDALLSANTGKFLDDLRNSGRYRVIEREKLTEILKEHALHATGAIDITTATDLGKILGVDAIVLSSVSRIHYKKNMLFGLLAWVHKQTVEIDMEARIVDVNTAEVLSSAKVSTESWDRKWVALFVFRLGGKNNQEQLESMALEYAISSLANQLASTAIKE